MFLFSYSVTSEVLSGHFTDNYIVYRDTIIAPRASILVLVVENDLMKPRKFHVFNWVETEPFSDPSLPVYIDCIAHLIRLFL